MERSKDEIVELEMKLPAIDHKDLTPVRRKKKSAEVRRRRRKIKWGKSRDEKTRKRKRVGVSSLKQREYI